MTTEPGRYADSRAILIGVSAYEEAAFPSIRAARNSLYAMQQVLTDPTLCGWPPERVTTISNPVLAQDLAVQVAELTQNTTGVLLVYYVGHGVLSSRGELCLTVTSTLFDHPKVSGLPWDTLAESLRTSPADIRLVILDCCFAGQAIEALSGNDPGLADITHVQGAYTLTATTRNRAAYVPPTDQQDTAPTCFTGELYDLIRSGIPGKPAQLTLGDLYPVLRQRLRAKGLPLPNQRGTDTVQQFPFTFNAALNTRPRAPLGTQNTTLRLTKGLAHGVLGRTRAIHYAMIATAFVVVLLLAFVITPFLLRSVPPVPGSIAGTPPAFTGVLDGAGDVRDVVFSPDGKLLAAAGGNDHTVTLWNADTGQRSRILVGCCVVSAAAFSPDNQRLATDGDLFDATTGDHIRELDGSGYSVAFSPDGKFLAVGSGYDPNTGTRLFDSATGELVRTLSTEYASTVAFSPDSEIIASATGYLNEGMRLWNPITGQLVRTLGGGSDAVAFSPQGKVIATSGEGRVQMWDSATGDRLRDIEAAQVLTFGPDGNLYAADANHAVRLYDSATGNPICTLADVYADSAALSPDGKRIATVTPNKSIELASIGQGC